MTERENQVRSSYVKHLIVVIIKELVSGEFTLFGIQVAEV